MPEDEACPLNSYSLRCNETEITAPTFALSPPEVSFFPLQEELCLCDLEVQSSLCSREFQFELAIGFRE